MYLNVKYLYKVIDDNINYWRFNRWIKDIGRKVREEKICGNYYREEKGLIL